MGKLLLRESHAETAFPLILPVGGPIRNAPSARPKTVPGAASVPSVVQRWHSPAPPADLPMSWTKSSAVGAACLFRRPIALLIRGFRLLYHETAWRPRLKRKAEPVLSW